LIAEFPPGPEYFAVNPLGQVPALEDRGHSFFPTRSVLEHIVRTAQNSPRPHGEVSIEIRRLAHSESDDQLFTVLLAMGDMLVAVQYRKWAGLVPQGPNHLNYQPVERDMERVYRTLDWLEKQIGDDGFFPSQICVQDIVLACLILWTESRGPIDWRGRPKLEAVLAKLRVRPSFVDTAPLPLDH
jgi:glutathione S-transferase